MRNVQRQLSNESPNNGLTFRGSDPYEVEKPLRRLIRERIPRTGRVFTDIDLMVRHYNHSDRQGVFRLIETKHGNAQLSGGQAAGFKLVHTLLRAADPDGTHYQGFYRVSSSDPEWGPESTVTVERLWQNPDTITMTLDAFLDWLDYPALQSNYPHG